MELETIILPIMALILSGLTWTLFGAFSNWRKTHGTPEWKGFDLSKLRNDAILGLILGVGTIIATILTSQDGNLTSIATAQEFIIAIAAGFGLVAAVDKFIIGGILGK